MSYLSVNPTPLIGYCNKPMWKSIRPHQEEQQILIRKTNIARILKDRPYSTYAEIASELGLSAQLVSSYVKQLSADWREQTADAIDAYHQQALRSLSDLLEKATKGYQEAVDSAGASSRPALAWLARMRELEQDRISLLGLSAPQQIEVSHQVNYNISSLSAEEQLLLQSLLEKAEAGSAVQDAEYSIEEPSALSPPSSE